MLQNEVNNKYTQTISIYIYISKSFSQNYILIYIKLMMTMMIQINKYELRENEQLKFI